MHVDPPRSRGLTEVLRQLEVRLPVRLEVLGLRERAEPGQAELHRHRGLQAPQGGVVVRAPKRVRYAYQCGSIEERNFIDGGKIKAKCVSVSSTLVFTF